MKDETITKKETTGRFAGLVRGKSDRDHRMEELILNAIRNLDGFRDQLDKIDMFTNCQGIAFISAVEVACLVSGNIGSGIVLRQYAYGNWSPPCAISLTGLGAGLVAGYEKKDIVIFVMDKMTMHAFCGEGQLRLGIQNAFTAGPVNSEWDLTLHASNRGFGATTSFVHSKGLLVGISLDGAVIVPKSSVNAKFYGRSMNPNQILYGQPPALPECPAIQELHEKLQDLIIKRREAARLHEEFHVKDDTGAYVSVVR